MFYCFLQLVVSITFGLPIQKQTILNELFLLVKLLDFLMLASDLVLLESELYDDEGINESISVLGFVVVTSKHMCQEDQACFICLG